MLNPDKPQNASEKPPENSLRVTTLLTATEVENMQKSRVIPGSDC